jgi:hypothetical protein
MIDWGAVGFAGAAVPGGAVETGLGVPLGTAGFGCWGVVAAGAGFGGAGAGGVGAV